jgi:hypothetical protein
MTTFDDNYQKALTAAGVAGEAHTAKLPSTQAPGWKNKRIVSFAKHGNIAFWSLVEDGDDAWRNIFVVVNGVLIAVGAAATMKQQIENRAVPSHMSELLLLLKESMRKSDMPAANYPVVWEALGLPEHERLAKVQAVQERLAVRQKARHEFEAGQTAKAEAAEADKIKSLAAKILTGQSVSGPDLAHMAKHVGLSIKPQVMGVLKKMVEVGPTSIRGPATKSIEVFRVYPAVKIGLESKR